MRGGAPYVRFATVLLHCTLTEEAFFDALAREVGTLLGGGEYIQTFWCDLHDIYSVYKRDTG